MNGDPAGARDMRDEPHRDIESLIRATHADLGRIAFRCLRNRADAEDAVQSECIRVLLCWPKIESFETTAQQRAYLITTVTNEALQMRRQAYRRREVAEAEAKEFNTSLNELLVVVIVFEL